MADRKNNRKKNNGFASMLFRRGRREKEYVPEDEVDFIELDEEEDERGEYYARYEEYSTEDEYTETAAYPEDDYEDEGNYEDEDDYDEEEDDYEEQSFDFDFDRYFGGAKSASEVESASELEDDGFEEPEERAEEDFFAEVPANSRRISVIDDEPEEEIDFSNLASFMQSIGEYYEDGEAETETAAAEDFDEVETLPEEDDYDEYGSADGYEEFIAEPAADKAEEEFEIEINYNEDENMDFSHLHSYIEDSNRARAEKETEDEFDFDGIAADIEEPVEEKKSGNDMSISFDDDDDEPIDMSAYTPRTPGHRYVEVRVRKGGAPAETYEEPDETEPETELFSEEYSSDYAQTESSEIYEEYSYETENSDEPAVYEETAEETYEESEAEPEKPEEDYEKIYRSILGDDYSDTDEDALTERTGRFRVGKHKGREGSHEDFTEYFPEPSIIDKKPEPFVAPKGEEYDFSMFEDAAVPARRSEQVSVSAGPELDSSAFSEYYEQEEEKESNSARGLRSAMEREARMLREQAFNFDPDITYDDDAETVTGLDGDDEDGSFDSRFDMRRPVVGVTHDLENDVAIMDVGGETDDRYEEERRTEKESKKAAIGKFLSFLSKKSSGNTYSAENDKRLGKKTAGAAAAAVAAQKIEDDVKIYGAETAAAYTAAVTDDDDDMIIADFGTSSKKKENTGRHFNAENLFPEDESYLYDDLESEEYEAETEYQVGGEEEPTVTMAHGYSAEELHEDFHESVREERRRNRRYDDSYGEIDHGRTEDYESHYDPNESYYDYDDPDGDDFTDKNYADEFPTFREFVVADIVSLIYKITGKGKTVNAAANSSAEDGEDLGPEAKPADAMRHYGLYTRPMRARLKLAFVMLLPMIWLSMGLPVPGMLKNPTTAAAALLAMQFTVMLIALDVVTNGIMNAVRGKIGADSMAVLACIFTASDALLTAKEISAPHTPLCVLSAFSVVGILFACTLTTRAMRKTMRVPAIGQKTYILTAEHDLLGKDDVTLLKSDSGYEGFVRRAEEAAPDEWMYLLYSPYVLIAAALISVIIAAVTHDFKGFIYVFSAVLTPLVPFTALVSFAMPFFIGSLSIFSKGSAVAGWSGINGIGRSKDIVITDRDLFPDKCVKIAQVRMYENVDEKTFISYAGSMIVASGSCVAGSFAEFMKENNISRRPVEGYEYDPCGGYKGIIDSNIVLCGNADMMRMEGIAVRSSHVKPNTIVIAVNGVLCGFVDVEYSADPTIRNAIIELIASSRHPVFAIRDFNVTPQLINQIYDVPTDGYDFPSYIERFRISSASPDSKSQPMAVICLEGLDPLIATAKAGRAMYVATNINMVISLIGAVLGAGIALMQILTAGVVAVPFMTIFSVIMALPVMFVSLYMKL